MSREHKVLKDIRTELERDYGPLRKRVAVLGSFDTWSYMDFVCRRLVEMGYTAFTSRYTYVSSKLPDGTSMIGRAETTRPIDHDLSLVQFLKSMLDKVSKAVVIYSVCGAHYIETDWLSEGNWNVVGVTFVRGIGMENSCLTVLRETGCSVCSGKAPIWGCMKKHWCPFQRQEISKDVIERYLLNKRRMLLVAIESLDNVTSVLEAWLSGHIRRILSKRI